MTFKSLIKMQNMKEYIYSFTILSHDNTPHQTSRANTQSTPTTRRQSVILFWRCFSITTEKFNRVNQQH